MSDHYVECSECGHPVERHDQTGCHGAPGCDCREAWTRAEIARTRRAAGLPARWAAGTI